MDGHGLLCGRVFLRGGGGGGGEVAIQKVFSVRGTPEGESPTTGNFCYLLRNLNAVCHIFGIASNIPAFIF